MSEEILIKYVGPSMNPTFKTHDMLIYRPVPISDLRKGDIIVFVQPQKKIQVIHRVSAVNGENIHTRGDNNRQPDPYTLTQTEILGRVVSATRGKKRIRVYNGMTGRVQVSRHRMVKFLRGSFISVIQPPYSFLSEHRIISRWTGRWLTLRVVECKRPAGKERYATLYGRVVAYSPPGTDRWTILPPYRIVIDDSLLA